MSTHAAPVTKAQIFTLAVGALHPDDNAPAVVRLAHELEKIVEAANRAVMAAREGSDEALSASTAVRCCASCAGLGQALGECAECVGTGRAS